MVIYLLSTEGAMYDVFHDYYATNQEEIILILKEWCWQCGYKVDESSIKISHKDVMFNYAKRGEEHSDRDYHAKWNINKIPNIKEKK
jgi:hypothetical protein